MANITKRGESYRIRVYGGEDSTGKQIVKSKTWTPAPGMTARQIERELNRQATLFEEQVRTGLFLDGSIKFRDFAEQWFADYAAGQLKERTLERYHKLAERVYIAIGHIRLDKLQPQHLIAFYKQLEQVKKESNYTPKPGTAELVAGLGVDQKSAACAAGISAAVLRSIRQGANVSPTSAEKIAQALQQPVTALFERAKQTEGLAGKTIKHYHTFISSVLDRAVKWQMIPDNPCRRVDAPRVDRKRVQCMDEKQIGQFIQALQTEPLEYQAIFLLLILTGMRRGELLGLEWPDIDLQAGTLRIVRTSQYTPQRGIYTDTPKTDNSSRPLAIPGELAELLTRYRAEQEVRRTQLGERWDVAWTKHPRLFTQWDGKPMHPNAPYQEMQKILRRIGLPPYSLHSLRHTNATLLIEAGVDVRTVSGRLGHSQTSTTLNIYAEYLQSADSAASETLANVLIRK